jgi:endonuclease I
MYNDEVPMRADVHHVVPSDGKVNGWRDNLPFGVVDSQTTNPCNAGATNTPCHSTNGSKKGNNLNSGYSAGYSGTVFEPIDAFKGDIARAILYFATRYEDQIVSFYNANSSDFKESMNGSSNQVFTNTFLNILIKWHLQDPVSAKEIAINNAVYNHQDNRNPFIDTPGYVCQIWPTQCQALGTSSVMVDWETKVYPNPSSDKIIHIASNFELNEIMVFNMNGQALMQKAVDSNQLTLDLNHLSAGVYILKMQTADQIAYKKLVLN